MVFLYTRKRLIHHTSLITSWFLCKVQELRSFKRIVKFYLHKNLFKSFEAISEYFVVEYYESQWDQYLYETLFISAVKKHAGSKESSLYLCIWQRRHGRSSCSLRSRITHKHSHIRTAYGRRLTRFLRCSPERKNER